MQDLFERSHACTCHHHSRPAGIYFCLLCTHVRTRSLTTFAPSVCQLFNYTPRVHQTAHNPYLRSKFLSSEHFTSRTCNSKNPNNTDHKSIGLQRNIHNKQPLFKMASQDHRLQQVQQVQQPVQTPSPGILAPPPYSQQLQQQGLSGLSVPSLNTTGAPPTNLRACPQFLSPVRRGRQSAKGEGKTEVPPINPPEVNKVRPANPKHTVMAMVVDRSGSMGSMGAEVHGGCNAYLEQCRAGDAEDATTTTVSFTRFDNTVESLFDSIPLSMMPAITAADVSPRGSTALYDAIGCTLQKTVTTLEKLDHVPSVVIYILTDGAENASQIWDKASVTKEIKKLQAEPYNWDFYFAAANQNAMAEGHKIGMDMEACMTYSSSPKGMSSAFACQAQAHLRKKRGGSKGYTPQERAQCSEY